MKQFLLRLSLLLGATTAGAQAPAWVERNTTAPIHTPSGVYAFQTVTVNATTAWHLLAPSGADLGLESATHLARTTDGVEWFYLPIEGTPGFQALHLTAVDANTAYVAQVGAGRGGPSGGGEILRTPDGGQSWQKVTGTEFTRAGSFLFWVHFFDATTGLAFGAPVDGHFEVYRTSDGAATWQRVPAANLPAPLPGERSAWRYFAWENTVWVGMGNFGAPVRILKTTDRGLSWSASPLTALSGYVANLAFKDPDNGLAYSVYGNSGQGTLIRTTDGGATWAPITPASTAQGRFYGEELDAIPGAYVSAGVQVGPPRIFGSSVSADGLSWQDIAPGPTPAPFFFSLDAVSPTVAFAGSLTGAGSAGSGAGGFHQLRGTLPGAVVTAAAGGPATTPLTVYPNPSPTGVFHLQLPAARTAGDYVRVWDLVGREVLNQPLLLSGTSARALAPAMVDLSHAAVGWYTLEVRRGSAIERVRIGRQ